MQNNIIVMQMIITDSPSLGRGISVASWVVCSYSSNAVDTHFQLLSSMTFLIEAFEGMSFNAKDEDLGHRKNLLSFIKKFP